MRAIRSFAGDPSTSRWSSPRRARCWRDFDSDVRHVELSDGDAFARLELIDIPAEAAADEPWFNETLDPVNDAVVRLGVIEGDFHWHKHDDQDEFFLVLAGELLIDLEDRETVALRPHQAYTVPRASCTAPAHRADGDPHGRGGRRQPDRLGLLRDPLDRGQAGVPPGARPAIQFAVASSWSV